MDPDVISDNGAAMYGATPSGGDTDTTTHVQPVPDLADDVLPGEQDDPRLC